MVVVVLDSVVVVSEVGMVVVSTASAFWHVDAVRARKKKNQIIVSPFDKEISLRSGPRRCWDSS